MFKHHDHNTRKACEGFHNVSVIRRVDVLKTDQCGSVGPLGLGKNPKMVEEWLHENINVGTAAKSAKGLPKMGHHIDRILSRLVDIESD